MSHFRFVEGWDREQPSRTTLATNKQSSAISGELTALDEGIGRRCSYDFLRVISILCDIIGPFVCLFSPVCSTLRFAAVCRKDIHVGYSGGSDQP
jgi:hypothetical protein